MTESAEKPWKGNPKKRLWKRIVACVLAAMMLLSIFALDAVRIKLRQDAKTDITSAAADTLEADSEYMEGTTAERLTQWLQSVLQSPESFEDYYQIATILIAQGEYRRALVNINESIRLYDGEDVAVVEELYMKQGGLYAMLGEYAAMEESFAHIREESGYFAQTQLLIGQAAIESGNVDKSIEHLERYLVAEPAAFDILLALGQLYVSKEAYEDAADAYGRAMALYEDTSGTLAFLRGSCYMEIQEYALALVDFQDALSRGYADQALCAAQCSLCSFLCGEYEACLSYGTQALESPSEDVSLPDLAYYMGLAAMTIGEYEAARDYFLMTAELDETRLDSVYYATVCIMALGMYNEAIQGFTGLIEQEYEGLSLCYYNRAVCYVQTRAYKLAREDLQKVVDIHDDEELVATADELLKKL